MTVSKILITVPLIRFGWIVLAIFIVGIGGEDRSPLIQVQSYVAFKANRKTAIGTCKKLHRATTSSSRSVDSFVHGRRIERLSIALSTESSYIIDCLISCRRT